MCFYMIKKRLGKKDKKGWHYNKILVHLKEFVPILQKETIAMKSHTKTF